MGQGEIVVLNGSKLRSSSPFAGMISQDLWRDLRRRMTRRGVLAGLGLAGFGAGVVALAAMQPVGTVSRMGPGFLPLVVGLAVLACAAVVALRRDDAAEPTPIGTGGGACTALAGVAAFGLLAEPAGVLVASAALGVCASLSVGLTPLRAAGVGLAAGPATALLFATALKVPFRLTPL
jgi:hypothetical protein